MMNIVVAAAVSLRICYMHYSWLEENCLYEVLNWVKWLQLGWWQVRAEVLASFFALFVPVSVSAGSTSMTATLSLIWGGRQSRSVNYFPPATNSEFPHKHIQSTTIYNKHEKWLKIEWKIRCFHFVSYFPHLLRCVVALDIFRTLLCYFSFSFRIKIVSFCV